MIRILVITICTLLFLLAGTPEWLSDCSMLLRMTAYHFYHANIFHLAVNGLALWAIFSPLRKDNTYCLIIGYVIATLAYPLSVKPCIGLSNIIYAVIGLRTPPFSDRWWRSMAAIVFFSVTLAMLLVPSIAGVTHVVSLAAGIAAANIKRLWKR